MKIFSGRNALTALIVFSLNSVWHIFEVEALPTVTGYDEVTVQPDVKIDEVLENKIHNNSSTAVNAPVFSSNETNATASGDLETSESEHKEQTISPGPIDPTENSDNVAAGSSVDPSIFGGGFLSPEAFQQYISQFGGAYSPYGAAPYPAPVYSGYVQPPPPPIYPSPYVVETGYDGYLVPSPTATKASDTTSSITAALTSPLMILSNIISAIMMSTIFRFFATMATAVGMIFFSGTILNMFCTYTPICDISNKAVTYLRHQNTTENLGRMIAEEMTPERARRAAEFVRNAINKYHDLQQLMEKVTNSNAT